MTPRLIVALPLAVAALLTAGCDTNRVSTANDELRARVVELENENTSLRRRNAELASELQRESARPDSLPPAIRENAPHVAEVSIGRRSHALDTDDDGLPDRVTAYVHPVDGLGRFVQVAGSLTAFAMFFPPDAEPVMVGRLELDPAALRQAYRSSVTGTHYTIEVPIQVDAHQARESCLLRIRLEDGLTGSVHTAERDIPLSR